MILIVAIPIILLVLLGAILFYLIKQRKKEAAEKEQTMNELIEQVEIEKAQENVGNSSVPSQLILLLTEIKNCNEEIKKSMDFFKAMAIFAILLSVVVGLITLWTLK